MTRVRLAQLREGGERLLALVREVLQPRLHHANRERVLWRTAQRAGEVLVALLGGALFLRGVGGGEIVQQRQLAVPQASEQLALSQGELALGEADEALHDGGTCAARLAAGTPARDVARDARQAQRA